MGLRFVPLPYEALAAVGPEGYRGLVDLYQRAHLGRWGWLQVTEAQLQRSWDCSARTVWRVLEGLVAAGLAELERGTPARLGGRPTRVRLLDPQRVGQDVGQEPGQRTAAAPATRSATAGQGVGQGAGHARERDRDLTHDLTDPHPPDPPSPGEGGTPPADVELVGVVTELLDAWSDAEPRPADLGDLELLLDEGDLAELRQTTEPAPPPPDWWARARAPDGELVATVRAAIDARSAYHRRLPSRAWRSRRRVEEALVEAARARAGPS
jgi:hypothetical protein